MSTAETTPPQHPAPTTASASGIWDESLEHFREGMSDFVKEREWHEFHTPRNLALAIVGEVGEIAEALQWRGEVPKNLEGWNEKDRHHMGEEIADVFLYLVRFADECGINLVEAAKKKMKKNALKYPAGRCRGSAKKYNEYKDFDEQEVEKEIEKQDVKRQLVGELSPEEQPVETPVKKRKVEQ
jgi:dCTP diphosphatase